MIVEINLCKCHYFVNKNYDYDYDYDYDDYDLYFEDAV